MCIYCKDDDDEKPSRLPLPSPFDLISTVSDPNTVRIWVLHHKKRANPGLTTQQTRTSRFFDPKKSVNSGFSTQQAGESRFYDQTTLRIQVFRSKKRANLWFTSQKLLNPGFTTQKACESMFFEPTMCESRFWCANIC